jgi:hypothetical protein
MMMTPDIVPVIATGLSLGSSVLVALLAISDRHASADLDRLCHLGDDPVVDALTRVPLPLELEAPSEIGSVR